MKYTLRPPQLDVKNQIRESVRQGKKKILVFACTSFGKTILSYDIIKSAIERGNRVLFTSHRITLAEQSAEKFSDLNPSYLQGDRKEFDSDYKVLVATLQTLVNTEIVAPNIVLIDECHWSYESNLIQSLFEKWPDAIFIGLSATPVDDRGFLLDGFETIIDTYQTKNMIELGWVTPFKVFCPMSINTSAVKMKGDDFDPNSLETVINKDDINDSIVDNYIELGESRKFIAFAVNKKHCQDLCQAFERQGIQTAVITADTSKKKRDQILADFAANKLKGLISIEILTAGFDDPTVSLVIMATVTKSWKKFVQCCGRGIRLLGGGINESIANGKSDCILLDCCGNVEEHGFPDDRKELKFKKKISRVIDRELGLDTDNELRQTVVMTEEKQIYLKRIGSLLDLYEGKVYKLEAELQEDVNSYLKKTGYFWWRQNSGKAFMKDSKGVGRWVHFASKSGLPDNSVFYDMTSLFFGMELKLPWGKLTDYQKETLPEMTDKRVLYFIIESVYDVFMAIDHVERNIIRSPEGVMIFKSIYNLPQRQIELRNRLKLETYK